VIYWHPKAQVKDSKGPMSLEVISLHRRCEMLQRASQIQEQMSEIKEEIRKKRLAIEFQQCQSCHSEIRFEHQISKDFRSGHSHVVESGQCPRCLGRVEARQFQVH
jgi:uncharacterized protein with PIN domain